MKKASINTSLIILSSLAISEAFTVTSTTRTSHCHSTRTSIFQRTKSSLSSSAPNNEEEDQPSELLIGTEMSNALQGLGSEAGYLDLARKRNEEGKAKMMEQIRLEEEETERKRQWKKQQQESGEGNAGDYGPGDLSGYVGFKDDGFVRSAGNDGTGGWGDLDSGENAEGEGEGGDGGEGGEGDEDEPKLFLFGDDDGAGSNGGLIL